MGPTGHTEDEVDLTQLLDEAEERVAALELVVAEWVLDSITDIPLIEPDDIPGVTAATEVLRHRPGAGAVEAPLGGFDEGGRWHDPGDGQFATPGWSTAKGLALAAARDLFARDYVNGKPDGEWVVARDNYLSRVGVKRGQAVRVKYLDDTYGAIDVKDGDKQTTYKVKWTRFVNHAPTGNEPRVDSPEFTGNTTRAKIGHGQATAQRIQALGETGGPVEVHDAYLSRYGISKGDIVTAHYVDDQTAKITTTDGAEITASWSRFTDGTPIPNGSGWTVEHPPEGATPAPPPPPAPSPLPDGIEVRQNGTFADGSPKWSVYKDGELVKTQGRRVGQWGTQDEAQSYAAKRFGDTAAQPPTPTPGPSPEQAVTLTRDASGVSVAFPDGSTETLTGKPADHPFAIVWQRRKDKAWAVSSASSRESADKAAASLHAINAENVQVLDMPGHGAPDAPPVPTPPTPEAPVPTTIDEARVLGEEAFKAGLTNAPALDSKLVLNPEVGKNTEMLRAWQEGWTKANLDQPVPEPTPVPTPTPPPAPEVPRTVTGATLDQLPVGTIVSNPDGAKLTVVDGGLQGDDGTFISHGTAKMLLGNTEFTTEQTSAPTPEPTPTPPTPTPPTPTPTPTPPTPTPAPPTPPTPTPSPAPQAAVAVGQQIKWGEHDLAPGTIISSGPSKFEILDATTARNVDTGKEIDTGKWAGVPFRIEKLPSPGEAPPERKPPVERIPQPTPPTPPIPETPTPSQGGVPSQFPDATADWAVHQQYAQTLDAPRSVQYSADPTNGKLHVLLPDGTTVDQAYKPGETKNLIVGHNSTTGLWEVTAQKGDWTRKFSHSQAFRIDSNHTDPTVDGLSDRRKALAANSLLDLLYDYQTGSDRIPPMFGMADLTGPGADPARHAEQLAELDKSVRARLRGMGIDITPDAATRAHIPVPDAPDTTPAIADPAEFNAGIDDLLDVATLRMTPNELVTAGWPNRADQLVATADARFQAGDPEWSPVALDGLRSRAERLKSRAENADFSTPPGTPAGGAAAPAAAPAPADGTAVRFGDLANLPPGTKVRPTAESKVTFTTSPEGLTTAGGSLLKWDSLQGGYDQNHEFIVGAAPKAPAPPPTPPAPPIPEGAPTPSGRRLATDVFPDATAEWPTSQPAYVGSQNPDRYTTYLGAALFDPKAGTITVLLPDGTTVEKPYKANGRAIIGRDEITGLWDAKIQKSSYPKGMTNTASLDITRQSPLIAGLSDHRKALAANSLLGRLYEVEDGGGDVTKMRSIVKARLKGMGYTPNLTKHEFVPIPPAEVDTPPITDATQLADEVAAITALKLSGAGAVDPADLVRDKWIERAEAAAVSAEARFQAGDPQWDVDRVTRLRRTANSIRFTAEKSGRITSSTGDGNWIKSEKYQKQLAQARATADELIRFLSEDEDWKGTATQAIVDTIDQTLKPLLQRIGDAGPEFTGATAADQKMLRELGGVYAHIDALFRSTGIEGSGISGAFGQPGITDAMHDTIQQGYDSDLLTAFVGAAQNAKARIDRDRSNVDMPPVVQRILAAASPDRSGKLESILAMPSRDRVDAMADEILRARAESPHLSIDNIRAAVNDAWYAERASSLERGAGADARYAFDQDLRDAAGSARFSEWLPKAIESGAAFERYGTMDDVAKMDDGTYAAAGGSSRAFKQFGARVGATARKDSEHVSATMETALEHPPFAEQVAAWGGPAFLFFTKGSKGTAWAQPGTSMIGWSKSRTTGGGGRWQENVARFRDATGIDVSEQPVSSAYIKTLGAVRGLADDYTGRSVLSGLAHNTGFDAPSIAKHEYGHIVDGRIGTSFRNTERQAFRDHIRAHREVVAEISTYATTNSAETFAEFYATVMHPNFDKRIGFSPEAERAFELFQDLIRPPRRRHSIITEGATNIDAPNPLTAPPGGVIPTPPASPAGGPTIAPPAIPGVPAAPVAAPAATP